MRITADANDDLKLLVQENTLRWAEEGHIPVRVAHQIARLGPLYGQQKDAKGAAKLVKVWTQDAEDHDRFMAVLRGVPGWRPPEPDDPDEDDGKRTRGASPLPVGVRVFRPRQTILQRRIVVRERAHELPLDAQERALRAWCERTFGDTGCTWHAVIHQPEGRNDPRNWHAHTVYTTCAIGREAKAERRETGRFDFEAGSTIPKMVNMGIVLDGNAPKKRRGMHDLVRKWRADMAEEQNAGLERAGVEKRYDPRSYRAHRIDLEATTHHGASRSALEASGRGALHWSAEASREWDRITQSVEYVPYASGEDRLRELGGLSERVRSGVDVGVVSTSQRDPIADDGYDAEVGGGVARGGCASAAVSAPRRCTPSSSPPSSTTSTHGLGSPMSSPASPSCRTPVCTNSCPETGKPSGTKPWPRRPTVTSRSVFERPGPAGADLTSRGTRRMGTSYLEVEQVGPVDAERVLAVVEELRFEAGLTASDASPDGVRVAQMLRSAIVPVPSLPT